MARRKRRATWRDRPLFLSRIPFTDDFGVRSSVHRTTSTKPITGGEHVKDQTMSFEEEVRANQDRKRKMSRAMRAGNNPIGPDKYKWTKRDTANVLGMYAVGAAGIIGAEAAALYAAQFEKSVGVSVFTILKRAAVTGMQRNPGKYMKMD
jgi:hypothetical protein